ncbi:hypothetical protein F2Q68_00034228 [Brassica cretica]|uniref:Uncharacterized protein n=1 Tax=Brassica cretica TaxID=69181 RepID=A0A8S9H245_BRACR|nr:hypothetical protein F2Q68_00034228 [Brassica cretica]
MLGQENVTTYVPEIKLRSNSILIKYKPSETYPDRLRIGPSMTIGTRTNQARSLCYYRTCTLSGRYVATERPFRSVATSGATRTSKDGLWIMTTFPKARSKFDQILGSCYLTYGEDKE